MFLPGNISSFFFMEYTFIDYSKKKNINKICIGYSSKKILLRPHRQVTAGNTTIYLFCPEEFIMFNLPI